ncbi:MAG: HD domain-containing phosphohydrolase [Candidatus Limnocylindrales bacterium]
MGDFLLDHREGRRAPRLLLLVFAASLALTGLTGAALAWVVGDRITETAVKAVASADGSLSQNFVTQNIVGGQVDLKSPTADQITKIQQELGGLVHGNAGLLRVKVHAPDGTILFSDDPSLRGKAFTVDAELSDALTGKQSARLITTFGPEEEDLKGAGATSAVEEYLPIMGPDGNSVQAVFEVYRDAGAMLTQIGQEQQAVILIVALATAILAVLLYLIFRAAQTRLDGQTEQLVEASKRDALTGLLNHGSVVAVLSEQVEKVREAGTGIVGLALVDVDNFKLLNDTYSHGAGDFTLLEVSRLLRAELSQASILGRFGPDEFLVVAPPECADDLEPAIERLREGLAELALEFGRYERLPVSVSAGVAYFPEDGDAVTELLSQATVALVEAKASGGNGVQVAGDASDDRLVAERSSFDVLQGLVIAVDNKDRYTKRHSEDVARYALFLADRIDLDPELRPTLHLAGLLHDVGKIGIPDTILRKPGPLTPEEYDVVKQHVALGDMIVRDLPNIDLVRGGVRHHHERWDGHGYLDRLIGEEIPIIARIMAIGDAFSAMTTTRPYRKALTVEEALLRLTDAAGSQLDPTLVVAFVEGIETVPDAPLPGQQLGPLPPLILTPKLKPIRQVA